MNPNQESQLRDLLANYYDESASEKDFIAFIDQAITHAREEERKKVIEDVKKEILNSKIDEDTSGSYNDCIDDVILYLESLLPDNKK